MNTWVFIGTGPLATHIFARLCTLLIRMERMERTQEDARQWRISSIGSKKWRLGVRSFNPMLCSKTSHSVNRSLPTNVDFYVELRRRVTPGSNWNGATHSHQQLHIKPAGMQGLKINEKCKQGFPHYCPRLPWRETQQQPKELSRWVG